MTILIGAPGSGKGTIAQKVQAALGVKHVSTGAILRAAVSNGTEAGKQAQGYIDRGELVPDAAMANLIGELLDQQPRGAHLLLDGYPRTIAQAELLVGITDKYGIDNVRVVCIELSEDVILKRLGGRRSCPQCGASFHVTTYAPKVEGICDHCGAKLVARPDDQPETIRHRLEIYEEKTAPLIDWYRSRGQLVCVDAQEGSAAVARKIIAMLSAD